MSDALQRYLDTVRNEPFAWGAHDCAMFVAKAIDARSGTSWAQRVAELGIRSSRDFRRLQRAGGFEAALRGLLGEPFAPSDDATIERGDIVLVRAQSHEILAIAAPPVLLVAASTGFLPLPMMAGTLAWRVA